MNLKSKLKNPKVWMGIISALVLLINNIGEIFGFSVDVPLVNEGVSMICTILVILGVLSNPESNSKTDSDKKNEVIEADTSGVQIELNDDPSKSSEESLLNDN